MTSTGRDRDARGRARQARPRDALGRPLPYGAEGVEPVSEEPLPPEETIRVAREFVDAGRPFAAHEVCEARWKAGPAEERDLWQGLAQVCVVGEGIRERVGVAAQVFGTLEKASIPVRLISHGGTKINISFLVDEASVTKAVQFLHRVFW